MIEWVTTNWEQVVLIGTAVVLALRAVLQVLDLISHILPKIVSPEKADAWLAWVDGLAGVVKKGTLSVPTRFSGTGTGDGTKPPEVKP